MNHTSEIKLQVELDENRIPERILWEAPDGDVALQEARAMFLAVWDHKAKEALRIDLWTKDMPLEEMKLFFYQTLHTMADTFYKATQDEKMTDTMRDFCEYFAEKMDIIKK
jgi:gliding motility-associated protein gldC